MLTVALSLQSGGDHVGAKRAYLEVLAEFPNQLQALNNLGVIEAASGNYAAASKYFREVANLSPQKFSAWANLASALSLDNDLSGSEEAYVKAVLIEPKNIKILLQLGGVLRRLKKFPGAIHAYKQILDLDPENLEALNNLGNTYRDIGRLEEALASLQKAVELHGGNEVIYNNIATIFSDFEDYSKALEFYDLALRSNPRHILSLNGRGNVYREIGMLEESIASFEKATSIEPLSLISQSNLAGSYIASSVGNAEKIFHSKKALNIYLNSQKKILSRTFPLFALKHHVEQAQYIDGNKISSPGLGRFIESSQRLLGSTNLGSQDLIIADELSYQQMREYLGSETEYKISDSVRYGLNPSNDWKKIEQEYLDSNEVLSIDNFLTQEALEELYRYCLISKVWIREYPKSYLGAFGYQGFISELHLKIAAELTLYMPRIFKDYRLNHLWAFKYDTKLGAGINVHADPAKVNVNFWLTPDQFNLEDGRGGLKVYTKKAKDDWDFDAYNNNAEKIYNYLNESDAKSVLVPYKRNRCVLFNSVLFHETDRIKFSDQYEGRRINMTYLFGQK